MFARENGESIDLSFFRTLSPHYIRRIPGSVVREEKDGNSPFSLNGTFFHVLHKFFELERLFSGLSDSSCSSRAKTPVSLSLSLSLTVSAGLH